MNQALTQDHREEFDGKPVASESETKHQIRQKANALISDLADVDLSFAVEVTSAILGNLIKSVKKHGNDAEMERLYDMIDRAHDNATAA